MADDEIEFYKAVVEESAKTLESQINAHKRLTNMAFIYLSSCAGILSYCIPTIMSQFNWVLVFGIILSIIGIVRVIPLTKPPKLKQVGGIVEDLLETETVLELYKYQADYHSRALKHNISLYGPRVKRMKWCIGLLLISLISIGVVSLISSFCVAFSLCKFPIPGHVFWCL